jgi:hypothetical protein
MDEGHTFESTTRRRKRAFELAGVPAALLMLAVVFAFAGSAGAGTARVTATPSNTSPPAISGTVQQGQTLTAVQGAWSGTEPLTYTYEWLRCNAGGDHCGTIKGATGTTYLVQREDVNHTVRLTVTARNAEGASSATSVATAIAKPVTQAEPANTSSPTISGTVQEGQTLTADKGAWSGTDPITYSYTWQRCDSSAGRCGNIGGANHTTYTVQRTDIDGTLRVVVAAKNAAGTHSATSAPTAVVKAAIPAAVTLSSSTLQVVYNNPVTLSGTISTRQAGQSVTIQQQRMGFADTSFTPLATVQTNNDGAWTLSTKPTVQTTYQAHWGSAASSALTVGVKPLVTFHVITGKRFSTVVVAGHSFTGRYVQFQRRSSFGQWVTLKRVKLGTSSNAIFRATLPKGTSTLRIAISVNQAGTGYLGGISRTIVYHHA